MDIRKRIKELPPQEVCKQANIAFTKLLQDPNRGRECLDSMRKIMQLLLIHGSVVNNFLKKEAKKAEKNGSASIYGATINFLMKLLDDENVPSKLRLLSSALLGELVEEDNGLFKKDWRQHSRNSLVFILPILFGSRQGFELNFENFHYWLSGGIYQLRNVTFPAIMLALRGYPQLFTPRHVRVLEAQMAQWLSNASRVSAKESGVSFLKINSSKQQPITELDGTPARDFYTILNVTHAFTEDQVFNVQSFSVLYTWLQRIHNNNKRIVDPDEPPIKINENFQKSVLAYCLRLLDQVKLEPSNISNLLSRDNAESAVNASGGCPRIEELLTIETVRILDVLCSIDRSLVPEVFGTMKKLSANINRTLSLVASHNRISGQLVLVLLQFFINHGETMVYDVDPVLRAFLENYISVCYDDPIIAFDTLSFFLKNKRTLLHNTHIFSQYFPAILKLFAWNPEFHREMQQLFSALISENTFVEIFHSILDLPLVIPALVNMRKTTDGSPSGALDSVRSGALPHPSALKGQSMDTFTTPNLETAQFRVLYNYLLRNESGVSVNWWSQEGTRIMINTFCNELIITPHILEVAEHVPSLLSTFFDVLIAYAEESCLEELLPIICERFGQLFPLPDFIEEIQEVMVTKVLAILEKYPHFIFIQKDLLIQTITSHSMKHKTLILHICWAIGEYCSYSVSPELCNPEICNDYEEALELLAFECMVTEEEGKLKQYNNQLMSVLISSLSKLAARCPGLSSRVSLCLIKIERYEHYFDEAVIEKAMECLNLLKFPSIAAAILDSKHKTSQWTHHTDTNSSLPFILMPTHGHASVAYAQQLHQFSTI
eukprot:TRINITY_DN8537_c0_g1_i1.p1 TRINITY_DN8537_c0_g1~~TRINITY_DN8537_c0_g1_i1.p1  ORF type:complete len:833 (+),score=161.78 TRINITY_DN8537_c0_g1_i1:49-2547(+)